MGPQPFTTPLLIGRLPYRRPLRSDLVLSGALAAGKCELRERGTGGRADGDRGRGAADVADDDGAAARPERTRSLGYRPGAAATARQALRRDRRRPDRAVAAQTPRSAAVAAAAAVPDRSVEARHQAALPWQRDRDHARAGHAAAVVSGARPADQDAVRVRARPRCPVRAATLRRPRSAAGRCGAADDPAVPGAGHRDDAAQAAAP